MALGLRWKTLAQACLIVMLWIAPCHGQIKPKALNQEIKPIAPNQEYKVKASFLINFAKFTTWPRDLLAKNDRFQLCILGSDPFGLFLDILAIRDVRGHEVDLLRLKPGDQTESCHLLFLAEDAVTEKDRLPEQLSRRGLFVVADTPGSAKLGAGETLLAIINDILDLSKIEAGKLEVLQQKFNLRDNLEGTFQLVADQARNKGLALGCHIAVDLPETVEGDPVRLRQILLNLLGNAVKFTNSGHVSLYANLLEVTEDHVRFAIDVEDTGIGIPPAKQDVIFESFAQADNGDTRQFGGTGLGPILFI